LCRDVYCARGYCGASYGFETFGISGHTDIGDEDNIDSIPMMKFSSCSKCRPNVRKLIKELILQYLSEIICNGGVKSSG
jgi:hypothetical protein